MGHRGGLDAMEKRNISCTMPEIEPRSYSPQPVTIRTVRIVNEISSFVQVLIKIFSVIFEVISIGETTLQIYCRTLTIVMFLFIYNISETRQKCMLLLHVIAPSSQIRFLPSASTYEQYQNGSSMFREVIHSSLVHKFKKKV